jgi:beta-mannosidase
MNLPGTAPYRQRLSGPWQATSVPLDADFSIDTLSFADARSIPECMHLQTALYPDRLYWGDHLRRLNEQAWFYRHPFSVPDQPYRRARLHFEAVDYFASVWLNGGPVGQHEGNFAPFTLDVTGLLRPGAENDLIVRVTSPWDQRTPRGNYPIDHVLRGLVKGLYEHGEGVIPPNVNPIGIWRPAWLLLDDGLSLDRVRIRTDLDGEIDLRLTATNALDQPWHGTLAVNITADNHDGPGVIMTTPLDLPPGTHDIDQTLGVPDPRLWWPWDQGDANLYRLTAHLRDESGHAVSTLVETFGIRTVRLDRSPDRFTYWINDRPVFVRGTSYMPGLYLSACSRDKLARDLSFARNANLNLLRVHVHVSPPDLYDLCDRVGMLIWQDFELNWVHDPSAEFEARALALQRDMMTLLGNHPSIITWACHNEPTMVFTRRANLEQRPDPALYRDAVQQDSTRPVFICSGQMESDWQRSGDVHSYYGALWTADYTNVCRYRFRLNTEFGFEAPAALSTLKAYPEAWAGLNHLENQIEALWGYQAELIRFHVEHFRRQRADGCAGYVHFWLSDVAPQVGCGVLDILRQPKGGYEALRSASQPLQVALEYDGRHPRALWVFNDTLRAYPGSSVGWQVYDAGDRLLLEGQTRFDVADNASQRVADAAWQVPPADCARVELSLRAADGTLLASNSYRHPFQPTRRPRGYPWKFDPVLSFKVFDRPGAPSLADMGSNWLVKRVPLTVRERVAEWALRQRLPTWLVSALAHVTDRFLQ